MVVDLDGTLLTDLGKLSKKTVNFILNNSKRYRFFLATGRSRKNAKHIYKKLKLKTPLITFNGHSIGYIKYDLLNQTIPIDILKKCLFKLTNYRIDDIYFENDNEFWYTKQYGREFPFFQKNQGKFIKNITQQQKILVTSLLVFVPKDNKDIACKCLKEAPLDITVWDAGKGFVCVEGLKKGISKATSISWLVNKEIMRPDFIFFGDDENDMSVFLKYSHQSFLMKNSLLELKKIKRTKFSNMNDGVIHTLENLRR